MPSMLGTQFFLIASLTACTLAVPLSQPRELMQFNAPSAPDAANSYGSQLAKPIAEGVGKRDFGFNPVSKAQSLALYRAAIKGTLDPIACLMGSYDESKSYCGAIQYYIIMVATAVVIPILCGLFTVLFYCCRACPCCKFKVCCYNCGGKQPRNRLTPEGQWVSGPYTKCEKSFWYSAHALVLAVLLVLSIGGGFSVSAIPDNIAIIFDAVIYVIEIPGKFFDQVASPAILVAITSMRAEVTDINSNYTAAALAVKSAAAALATACASGCCSSDQSKYAALRDLDALTKTFEPNAFTGFLNNTLNQKLIEGKDMVKKLNVPTDTVKSVKDFPKMIPAGTGFVLFAPVFLPILINLLAFLCKKTMPVLVQSPLRILVFWPRLSHLHRYFPRWFRSLGDVPLPACRHG